MAFPLALPHTLTIDGYLRRHSPQTHLLCGINPMATVVANLVYCAVPSQIHVIVIITSRTVIVELVVGFSKFPFFGNLATPHSLEIFVRVAALDGEALNLAELTSPAVYLLPRITVRNLPIWVHVWRLNLRQIYLKEAFFPVHDLASETVRM